MKSRLKTRENTRGITMHKIVRHWSDKYSRTHIFIFENVIVDKVSRNEYKPGTTEVPI